VKNESSNQERQEGARNVDGSRVIGVRHTQAQSDGAICANELEDNAEDVEPCGILRVVDLIALRTALAHNNMPPTECWLTSMMQTSHRAKPSHQISKASCRRALVGRKRSHGKLRDPPSKISLVSLRLTATRRILLPPAAPSPSPSRPRPRPR
jgi:hypothetical protein